MLAIVNDAAVAYRGVIPADRWHEPYMPESELREEIAAGVEFWGLDTDEGLIGIMGVQPVGDVDLIRHAYVRPDKQRHGVGAELIEHLRRGSTRRMDQALKGRIPGFRRTRNRNGLWSVVLIVLTLLFLTALIRG